MKVRIGCASWLTLLLVGSSIIIAYCKHGEDMFTRLVEAASSVRDSMAEFRSKLAQEEMLSFLPESSTTVTTTFQQPTMSSSVIISSYDKFLKNKLTPLVNFILPSSFTTTRTKPIINSNNEYKQGDMEESSSLSYITSLDNPETSTDTMLVADRIKVIKITSISSSELLPSSSLTSSLDVSSETKNSISSIKSKSNSISFNDNGTNIKLNVNSSSTLISNQHLKENTTSTSLITATINNNRVNSKNESDMKTHVSLDESKNNYQKSNQNSNKLQQEQQKRHYIHDVDEEHNDHKHLYKEKYQNQHHYQKYYDGMKTSNNLNRGNSGSASSSLSNNRNNLNNNKNRKINNSISNKSKRNVLQSDEPYDAASLQADLCAKFTIGDVDTKTFFSPNYPDNYPRNINCTKVITAPPDHRIRLDFRDVFNIEDKEECKFDYLEVRDGPYGFSKKVGSFCGRTFPEEIISTERHLWLYFHSDESIEYEGFTAVYEFIERPKNVPSKDLNCTIIKKGYEGWVNTTDVPQYVRDNVTEHKIPIDCMWRIEAPENWKIQTKFWLFDLKMPNDCNMNYIDIFPEDTTIPQRLKNFCGSTGEAAQSSSNILHIHYYAEHQAMASQFEILYTAYRDKGTSNCNEEHEYDCEDTTCISRTLKCNGRDNCKFRWDEENCKSEAGGQSEHVVIIIVVFGLILGGMIASFLFNCIRKLVRDQKIIREHIRQSKESKLDEMGRSSVKRSGENLSVKLSPKEKHSQTSLQILDDVSNRFYREMIPLPEIKADPILRHNHDIVAQTNLGPIIDDRESLSSPDRGIGNSTCDMGCQTRESLFSPPSTTTLVRQKSLGTSSSSPNQSQSAIRFSTFGYDTNNPPISQKSTSLSRHSTINNRTSAAIELEELQQQQHHHHHHTLPHNVHQHNLQQSAYPITYTKHPQTHHMGSSVDVPPLPASLTSGRQQPEVCHHHHQHKQHLQQQQLHAAQQAQQQQIGWKLACGGGGGGNVNSSNVPTTASGNKQQQQGKTDESKVYIDIRKSAPDVIIMTSH